LGGFIDENDPFWRDVDPEGGFSPLVPHPSGQRPSFYDHAPSEDDPGNEVIS
jgi:hypothetical protein